MSTSLSKIIINSTVCATLCSCAAVGPTDVENYLQLGKEALPVDDNQSLFIDQGQWYPNTRGFTDIRSSFLSSPTPAIPGLIVVTSKSIYFQQWDSNKNIYEIIKKIECKSIVSHEIDEFGRNRRVIVKNKDFSSDSFSATQASGGIIDVKSTEEMNKNVEKCRR